MLTVFEEGPDRHLDDFSRFSFGYERLLHDAILETAGSRNFKAEEQKKTLICAASALLCSAQGIKPGQVPEGPPPAPGQVGPASQPLPKGAGQATAVTNKPQTIGDVIGADTVDIRTTTRNILVPTTVLDPDGQQ